jgi:hypothetical protein
MAALVLLAAAGLVACSEPTPDAAPTDVPGGKSDRNGSDRLPATRAQRFPAPPNVRIEYGDVVLDLLPWTYCYANACADGLPPTNPPDVGSPEQVVISFPLEDWRIRADFEPVAGRCGPRFPATVEQIEPGRFVLRPSGHAGEYDVMLSARGYGPDGGDLYTTFRWTTPTDGPLPSPYQDHGRACD